MDELTEKATRIKRENHKLFKKIQAFKADATAQERFVRQQLGWVRENELMVEFITPKEDPQAPPKPSVAPRQPEAPPRTPEHPPAQTERKPNAVPRQPVPKKP